MTRGGWGSRKGLNSMTITQLSHANIGVKGQNSMTSFMNSPIINCLSVIKYYFSLQKIYEGKQEQESVQKLQKTVCLFISLVCLFICFRRHVYLSAHHHKCTSSLEQESVQKLQKTVCLFISLVCLFICFICLFPLFFVCLFFFYFLLVCFPYSRD